MKIIDFIIRVKNGYMAKKDNITVPHTNMIWQVAEILKKEGFISEVTKESGATQDLVTVTLKYQGLEPAFTDVKLISKPGRRIYQSVNEIRPVVGGMGIGILSTSRGVMTDKEARKLRVGGELLFQIW